RRWPRPVAGHRSAKSLATAGRSGRVDGGREERLSGVSAFGCLDVAGLVINVGRLDPEDGPSLAWKRPRVALETQISAAEGIHVLAPSVLRPRGDLSSHCQEPGRIAWVDNRKPDRRPASHDARLHAISPH